MSEPVFLAPGEAEGPSSPIGGDILYLARGEQTGESMFAFEAVSPPGQGPPLHEHVDQAETIYVLEGALRVKLAGELTTGSAGSFVFIPPRTPHTWQTAGDEPVRMLIHLTPAGLEHFFDDFAALKAPGPDDFARVAKGVGMNVLGPPLAVSDPL
jgi:quercetin dioxygenase-like cupin family protein